MRTGADVLPERLETQGGEIPAIPSAKVEHGCEAERRRTEHEQARA